MKTMFASVVCFGLIALMGTAAGGDKAAAKLEGTWIATGALFQNKKITEEMAEKLMISVIFKNGKYSLMLQGKEVESGAFRLDPQKATFIDLEIGQGYLKGKKHLGIYKVEDDKLTLALSKPDNKNRPKAFDVADDAEITFLKRKK